MENLDGANKVGGGVQPDSLPPASSVKGNETKVAKSSGRAFTPIKADSFENVGRVILTIFTLGISFLASRALFFHFVNKGDFAKAETAALLGFTNSLDREDIIKLAKNENVEAVAFLVAQQDYKVNGKPIDPENLKPAAKTFVQIRDLELKRYNNDEKSDTNKILNTIENALPYETIAKVKRAGGEAVETDSDNGTVGYTPSYLTFAEKPEAKKAANPPA